MRRREFIGLVGCGFIAWPLAARAQRDEKRYRVGYLALLPDEGGTFARPFLQRLQGLGYSLNKNLALEYRSAEGRTDRLAELAAELAHANVDVLVAGLGTLTAKAAATATKAIPIVFIGVGDPIGAGLVTSVRRSAAKICSKNTPSGSKSIVPAAPVTEP